jgi:hypothetical protein
LIKSLWRCGQSTPLVNTMLVPQDLLNWWTSVFVFREDSVLKIWLINHSVLQYDILFSDFFCVVFISMWIFFKFSDHYSIRQTSPDYWVLVSPDGRVAYGVGALNVLLQRWTNDGFNGKDRLDAVYSGENTSCNKRYF